MPDLSRATIESAACPSLRARCAVRNEDARFETGGRRSSMTAGIKGFETMFEKGLLKGKRILVTGGGSGLGAAMGRRFVELGAELIICGRRLELLEADGRADARRPRRQGQRRQMRHPRRRRGRCHDGCGLARGAARRARQQCRGDLHRADRASVVSRRRRDPRADPARRDVLHARRRQALDRDGPQGRGAEHSLDLDHYRPRLHGAFRDGEVRRAGDDQEPGGGVGPQGHPHGGDRAGRISDAGCIGSASARGA